MSVREHWINVRVNPEELARIREKDVYKRQGEGTAQEIIDTYTKLSDAEREELRKEFT